MLRCLFNEAATEDGPYKSEGKSLDQSVGIPAHWAHLTQNVLHPRRRPLSEQHLRRCGFGLIRTIDSPLLADLRHLGHLPDWLAADVLAKSIPSALKGIGATADAPPCALAD